MQMAMTVGDCTGEDADLLRRSMGSKRGHARIDSLRQKLFDGMKRHGIVGDEAARIYEQIQAFANFGFAESHSLSFALLVYASSWIKVHYPAAFLAGLLRAQPMGFYSPATLTSDARRHGVDVHRPDILRSDAAETLEPADPSRQQPTGIHACLADHEGEPTSFDRSAPDETAAHRRDGNFVVRLGLAGVTGIGEKTARVIVDERGNGGAFRSMNDLVRRTGLTQKQIEALATSGALSPLGHSTREALWLAGAAADDRPELLEGTAISVQPPLFADPSSYERLSNDLWATGVSTDDHPLTHFRAPLDAKGVLTSVALRAHETGRRIEVAGLVTHRQRPATASGVTFINLEDEHGLVNVVCSQGVWARFRRLVRDSPALIVRGMLERSPEGVVNVVADGIEDLRVGIDHRSRDFR